MLVILLVALHDLLCFSSTFRMLGFLLSQRYLMATFSQSVDVLSFSLGKINSQCKTEAVEVENRCCVPTSAPQLLSGMTASSTHSTENNLFDL